MNEEQTLENVNEDLHSTPENTDTVAEINTNEANEENDSSEKSESEIDYAKVVEEDIRILKEEFPELSSLSDICELHNPLRYAALRDLGLTPAEAYLATAKRQKRDNRSHLIATHAVSTSRNGSMSDAELLAAREIFDGMPDSEIRKLYKRVTK